MKFASKLFHGVASALLQYTCGGFTGKRGVHPFDV